MDILFSIIGLENGLTPKQQVTLEISLDGKKKEIKLLSRLDTQSDLDYYQHGGILPFVLRQKLQAH